MSVINIEHISKLYGDRMVLDDLTASVDYGDKIGISLRCCVFWQEMRK